MTCDKRIGEIENHGDVARPSAQPHRGSASRVSRRGLLAGATAALSMPWVAKARAADRLTLRLDFTASGLHAPFYVGLKRGWFEKAGVDLYMEDGNGSNATVQLVGAGSFDVGLNSLAPMAVARSKGVPVTSVAGFVRKIGRAHV